MDRTSNAALAAAALAGLTLFDIAIASASSDEQRNTLVRKGLYARVHQTSHGYGFFGHHRIGHDRIADVKVITKTDAAGLGLNYKFDCADNPTCTVYV